MSFYENELSKIELDDDVILNSINIVNGKAISPLKILEIMDPDDWEKFTLEMVDHLKNKYEKVTQCGGSGDLGRDIICYIKDKEWINYQCKRYAKRLAVADVILEIGKVIYYSFKKEYTLPKIFYFVASKGSSSELLKFFKQTSKFKNELYLRWDKICRKGIRKEETVLTDELRKYIEEEVDFSIFEEIPPLESLEIHSKTKHHARRFGYYGKFRPKIKSAPEKINMNEIIYTQELLNAYSNYKSKEINLENLEENKSLFKDFNRARNNFYSAESLERFSRDYIHHTTYDDLKEECYEAIYSTIQQEHKNGYQKYLKTSEVAGGINYESHPLSSFIKQQDKQGLCHQLVNDGEVKWVEDEE